MTRRQVEVLEFLRDFRAREGYSPTMREIARGLGLSSVATVAEHMDSLESRRLIRRQRDRARSALITGRGKSLLSARESGAAGTGVRGPTRDRRATAGVTVIPLLGTIAAGAPIEAVPVPDELEVPAGLVAGRRCYALRVKGRSMIDEGIFDGDYVVVEEKPVPENGETVVALINGSEATLKKFYRERSGGAERIRLQPANPEMEPIYIEEEEGDRLEVQGKVRGVIRLL